MTDAERVTLWYEAACTPAEVWCMQRAAQGMTPSEIALDDVEDEARMARAYGGASERDLDQALVIAEARVVRRYNSGLLRVARYQLGLAT